MYFPTLNIILPYSIALIFFSIFTIATAQGKESAHELIDKKKSTEASLQLPLIDLDQTEAILDSILTWLTQNESAALDFKNKHLVNIDFPLEIDYLIRDYPILKDSEERKRITKKFNALIEKNERVMIVCFSQKKVLSLGTFFIVLRESFFTSMTLLWPPPKGKRINHPLIRKENHGITQITHFIIRHIVY